MHVKLGEVVHARLVGGGHWIEVLTVVSKAADWLHIVDIRDYWGTVGSLSGKNCGGSERGRG